jgi:hypothetical protein
MTQVDQYLVALWLTDAVKARTDFLPKAVEWNTSMPQIIVGLSMKGKLSTAQGIPPILALIWIKIYNVNVNELS